MLKEGSMRIGIAHWQGRVSPVFDVSDHLLLIDLENGRETHRENIFLSRRDPLERAKEVARRHIDVLLCGAISKHLLDMLEGIGVATIPFLSGEVDALLAVFHDGRLPDPRFMMPGCRGRRGRLGRRRMNRRRHARERHENRGHVSGQRN